MKLSEDRLRKIIRSSLNEAFKSGKLRDMSKEHGGIKHPFIASELSDDEVGDIGGKIYGDRSYEFNDGTRVPLNLSRENGRTWQNGNHEINRRFNHPDEYQRNYKWSNPDAGYVFGGARKGDNGKYGIHDSFRDSTPSYDLHRPDRLANWRHIFYDNDNGEHREFSYNLSPMQRAKEGYAMSGMSDKQKVSHLSNNYPDRVRSYVNESDYWDNGGGDYFDDDMDYDDDSFDRYMEDEELYNDYMNDMMSNGEFDGDYPYEGELDECNGRIKLNENILRKIIRESLKNINYDSDITSSFNPDEYFGKNGKKKAIDTKKDEEDEMYLKYGNKSQSDNGDEGILAMDAFGGNGSTRRDIARNDMWRSVK